MKKVKDTSKTLNKIDHEKIAKALGAERVTMPAKMRQALNTATNIEKQLLVNLLQHPGGYGVQMEGYAEIRVLEDRTFAVCEHFESDATCGDYEEKEYENVNEAVDSFLEIRHRRELGLDYFEEAVKATLNSQDG